MMLAASASRHQVWGWRRWCSIICPDCVSPCSSCLTTSSRPSHSDWSLVNRVQGLSYFYQPDLTCVPVFQAVPSGLLLLHVDLLPGGLPHVQHVAGVLACRLLLERLESSEHPDGLGLCVFQSPGTVEPLHSDNLYRDLFTFQDFIFNFVNQPLVYCLLWSIKEVERMRKIVSGVAMVQDKYPASLFLAALAGVLRGNGTTIIRPVVRLVSGVARLDNELTHPGVSTKVSWF